MPTATHYAIEDIPRYTKDPFVYDLLTGFHAHNVLYPCALMAELAYYHVPQWEVDANRRSIAVPCDAYNEIVIAGKAVDVKSVLSQSSLVAEGFEVGEVFAVSSERVIVVGILVNRLLFISCRGTHLLFDWIANLQARMMPAEQLLERYLVNSRLHLEERVMLHSGFAEEARLIYGPLCEAIRKSGAVEAIVVTGHSLGAAVGAVVQCLLERHFFGARVGGCFFGTPRFSNKPDAAFSRRSFVRRPGDVVPLVPPRMLGYRQSLYERHTCGVRYRDPSPFSWVLGDWFRWAGCLAGFFKPHGMETYRKEIGDHFHAPYAQERLAPYELLTTAHLASNP